MSDMNFVGRSDLKNIVNLWFNTLDLYDNKMYSISEVSTESLNKLIGEYYYGDLYGHKLLCLYKVSIDVEEYDMVENNGRWYDWVETKYSIKAIYGNGKVFEANRSTKDGKERAFDNKYFDKNVDSIKHTKQFTELQIDKLISLLFKYPTDGYQGKHDFSGMIRYKYKCQFINCVNDIAEYLCLNISEQRQKLKGEETGELYDYLQHELAFKLDKAAPTNKNK